jgi:hypothetical protein
VCVYIWENSALRYSLILILCLLIVGCNSNQQPKTSTPNPNEIQRGGVYATKNKEGQYAISKVLEVDDTAVHLRFYNEKFPEIPKTIDTSKLTYLIGHAPLAKAGFFNDSPKLIVVENVRDQELEGYKIYLEAMKGN